MTGLPSAGQPVTGLPSVGQPVSELSPERSGPPVLPYGESTLADLMPSVLAALGAPGERNPLRLRATEKACVVLVDGLGYEQLAGSRSTRLTPPQPIVSTTSRGGLPGM